VKLPYYEVEAARPSWPCYRKKTKSYRRACELARQASRRGWDARILSYYTSAVTGRGLVYRQVHLEPAVKVKEPW
jgi:hypothetical protein